MNSADIGNRTWWRTLIGLLWFAPLMMALRYWMVWDRLPARMASHFDAAGRANGWMPREVSLYFALGFLVFMLTICSVVLYVSHRKYPVGTLSWALLAFFHVEIWTILYMLDSTLDYNLYGTPIVVAPLMIVTPVGALVLIVITLREKCGTALPRTEVIAEEVHAGRGWGAIFIAPLLVVVWMITSAPSTSMRVAALLLGLIAIVSFGMAWDGFHYYFTRHGVEIRTLGFRLKSIPLGQIKQYAAEKWRPICGYGIRGMGNHRAYVWGNNGVRIQLYDGEVFLGHNDPQKLVHDLDVIKQFSHSS